MYAGTHRIKVGTSLYRIKQGTPIFRRNEFITGQQNFLASGSVADPEFRIHMFLGLPDPDPDPLVRGMDPDPALDPDPSIIMQK
jgi:hypothetical protein